MKMEKKYLFLALVALLVLAGCGKSISSTPPAGPTNLQIAEITTSTIKLVWVDKSNNETGFYLYRGGSQGAANTLVATLGKDVITYTDKNLEPATQYYYRLVAFNSTGSSASSNIVSSTTEKIPGALNAPGNLTVQGVTETTVTLSWVDHSDGESHFKIYSGISEGAMNKVNLVDSNVKEFTVSELKIATTYYFKVVAVNAYGESESSNIVSATTQTTLLEAPDNLQASEVNFTSLVLTWLDRADNEEGYRIYQGATLIKTLGVNKTDCQVTNLQPGTSYTFTVAAYNTLGESPANVTVTTLEKTEVSGTIVDSLGKGIEGVLVALGDYQTFSTVDGTFSLEGVIPGEYTLFVRGGNTNYYWSITEVVNVERATANLGTITAYRMRGIGVIVQSVTKIQSLAVNSLQRTTVEYKQDIFGETTFNEQITQTFVGNGLSLNSFSGMEGESGFVALQWEKGPEEVEHYEIIVPVNSSIWSSIDAHPEDPAFDLENPTAYLDFGVELWDPSPGQYRFIIIGYDVNGNQVYQLPTLVVSIGTMLDTYPTQITKDGDQLTWFEVVGADEYRVLIYDYATDVRVADSGSITGSSYPLPFNLQSGTHYKVYVDACAQDETGWTQEITRGINGFTR